MTLNFRRTCESTVTTVCRAQAHASRQPTWSQVPQNLYYGRFELDGDFRVLSLQLCDSGDSGAVQRLGGGDGACDFSLRLGFRIRTVNIWVWTRRAVRGANVRLTALSPLSELYGRKRPLFVGFVLFAVFQIPVAVAQNLETVLICRFLQGLFGSAPTAIVGGALVSGTGHPYFLCLPAKVPALQRHILMMTSVDQADFWDARERGFAMPAFGQWSTFTQEKALRFVPSIAYRGSPFTNV